MVVYSVMSIAIIVFGVLFRNLNYDRGRKTSILSVISIVSVMIFVYASRYYVGTDFGGYLRTFNSATYYSFDAYVDMYRDMGFYGLTWILNRLFQGNWYLYSITLALITYLPILLTIRNEIADDFIYSLLLYVFTMAYFNGFNGVRQAIAVSLVFYAYYNFFCKKKYIKYGIFLVVAYFFHSTVLFVLPFHILSKLKVKSITFKTISLVMIVSYFAIWNLWTKLIDLLDSIGQEKLASDYAEIVTDQGSSFLRLAVAILPVLLAMIFYKRLKEFDYNDTLDKDIILCTFGAIFTMFSMKYWLFSRVGLYFSISQVLLLPKLSKIFGDEKSQKAFMFIMIILYFGYMVALLAHGDGELIPYEFAFGKDLSHGL